MEVNKYSKEYSIIITILTFVALYFSFRRNNGFSLMSVICAISFPEYYLVYILAMNAIKRSPTNK